MKKIISLILCAVMLCACCMALADETPWTAENPGKLTVGVYDRSNMDSDYGTSVDNQWSRWIVEQVKNELNIDVTFVAISRSDSDSVIATMLAGKNAPDIVFTYDTNKVIDYIAQGGIADLTDAVEKYGADLKVNLAAVLPYGNFGGVQYTIPALRGAPEHLCSFIRKDWLDKIGYEMKVENGVGLISTSDLETILKTWKEQGIAEYPMIIEPESGCTEAESIDPVVLAFADQDNIDDRMTATTVTLYWPGVKEGYRYMNNLYNEGLINPDWAQVSDSSFYNQEIVSGRAGFFSRAYWNGSKMGSDNFIHLLYENDPEAEVVPCRITDDNGRIGMIDRYAAYGMFIYVPSYSEHVDEAVAYLNWQSKYEVFEYLNYGVEGEHYAKNPDGSHDLSALKPDASRRISVGDLVLDYNGDPVAAFNKAQLKDPANITPRFMDQIENCYTAAGMNTYAWHMFKEPIEALGDYGASLDEKAGEVRTKAIVAAPGTFDATWDALEAEFMSIGGEEVMEQKGEAYDRE